RPPATRWFSTTEKCRWVLPFLVRVFARRNIVPHGLTAARRRQDSRSALQPFLEIAGLRIADLCREKARKKSVWRANGERWASAKYWLRTHTEGTGKSRVDCRPQCCKRRTVTNLPSSDST